MKKLIALFLAVTLLSFTTPLLAKNYRSRLCSKKGYTCIKVRRGESWSKLWPDPTKRRIVMRVNRINTGIYRGMIIAVPNNLVDINHMDVAPLPYNIAAPKRKTIIIDIEKHAFGAYDEHGYLIHWGPVSGGKGWCPDTHSRCTTPRGTFYIYSKGTSACISKKFPIPEGGAPMPFCMYFFKGYAMHGSALPGYHASHGCVRMFYEDAEWLNKEFAKNGTKVIIR